MTTETLLVSPYNADFRQIILDEDFRDLGGGMWAKGSVGNHWLLTLTFQNLTGDNRADLDGQRSALRGKQNRLRVPLDILSYGNDYAANKRRGAGGGTPLLTAGVSPGATTLPIDGASTSIANWLRRGDYISVGNELKQVTDDVDTNGSGVATIPIWPEMHQAAANNDPVDISTPHGDFFLVDSQGFDIVPHHTDWLGQSPTLVLEEDVYS